MITAEIVDPGFLEKYTINYNLSLLVTSGTVLILVEDAHSNVLGLRYYNIKEAGLLNQNLKKVFRADKFLQLPYKKVKISFLNKDFTFVPEPLYEQVFNDNYLEGGLVESTSAPSSNFIESGNFFNVFSAPSRFIDLCKVYFPRAKYFHFMSTLLTSFHQQARLIDGKVVFCHLRDSNIILAYFDNGKMHFSNVFEFKSSKDFIYYVMLIYKQFNLNPENIRLDLSGMILEESEIFTYLKRYIRHLNFQGFPSYYKFGTNFNTISKHFFYDLFSIKLCN